MNFKHLVKTINRIISLLTLASIALLTMSFVFSFDAVNGYFKGGTLPILFWISFALGIILSLASAFAINKNQVIKTENAIKHWRVYIIFGAALAILSQIFNCLALNKYFAIASVSICFFALYVFFCGAREGYRYSHSKLAFLLLSVIFPLAMTIDNNSVLHRHSNSVENGLSSVFAIAFLVYVLYEGNRLFSGSHSRWHFASLLLISNIGLTLSVSYIIAYLLDSVNEKTRFFQMILILIISLFANVELQRFTKLVEARTKEEWDEIEAPTEEVTEE